jgi:16S rRNA processing protein RimM
LNAVPVIVGRVSGIFGVRGWVKIYSYTQPKDNIFSYQPWLVNGKVVQLQDGQVQGKGLVAKLRGYDDREAAALLVGCEIQVEQLPEANDGEYYWTELVGLQVINQQGIKLGTVSSLLETGAHDVLVLSGERERLIPYVDNFVLSVDISGGEIKVDWDADF